MHANEHGQSNSFDDADTTYHNSTHAMAVLQALHVMLTEGGVLKGIEGPHGSPEVLLLAGYLAAIVHDYGHPGVTNDFLVKVTVDDKQPSWSAGASGNVR